MSSKSIKWNLAQAAEVRWWQKYLSKKNVPEYLEWKKKYWLLLLDSISDVVQVKPGMKVLDAGCGPAGVFMVTAECKTDAIDPLIDEYDRKLKHFEKSKYPSVRFYASALEDFTPNKNYDVIFCMNAINHVSNLKKSMDNLVACTKPGGKIVLSIDAHNFSFFKYLFRMIPGDILHPHQYDEMEYEAKLNSRNCTIIKKIRLKKRFFFDHLLMVGVKGV